MTRRQGVAATSFIAAIATIPFLVPFLHREIFTFRDHLDYFEPLRYFTAQSLRQGILPLWNPYSGSGERWMANPQTGVFYPPAWLFLLFSFPRAYALFLWGHLALLGCGAFFCFRRWASASAALFGAVGMMLSGPTLSLLDVNNNLATLAWLPIILLCAMDRRHSERPLPMAISSVVLALAFLGGEPFFCAIGWMSFALILVWGRIRRIGDLAFGVLLAVAIAGAQIVPLAELITGSERSRGLDPRLAFAQSLAPWDWLTAAISPALAGFANLSQTFIPSLYLGAFFVAAVVLALVTGKGRWNGGERVALAAGLLLTVVAAGRTIPGVAALSGMLRLTVSRHPARLAPLVVFCLMLLAACGLDRLQMASRRTRILAAALPLLSIISAITFSFPRHPTLTHSIEPLAMGMLTVALLMTSTSVLARSRATLIVLVLVAAADLLHGGQPFFLRAPFTGHSPHRSVLANTGSKMARLGQPVAINAGHLFPRVPWMAGYLNLYDSIFDLSTATPIIPAAYNRFVIAAESDRGDLLNFAGAGYLLAPVEAPPARGRLLESSGGVGLYRNADALPMVSLWENYREVASDEAALHRIIEERFDPRRGILLTRPPAEFRAVTREGGNPGIFDLRYSVTTAGVRAVVRASRPAVLLVTQNDASGWEARIDGRPAVTARCDGLFRALLVPSGAHQIDWTYHPATLRYGGFLSAVGIILAVGSAIVPRGRKPLSRPDPAVLEEASS
jgi:hypothetical protein